MTLVATDAVAESDDPGQSRAIPGGVGRSRAESVDRAESDDPGQSR